MTARKTPPPPPDIPFQGLVKLAKAGWEGVPDSPNPFYFGAKDGLFLHRRSLLGRGVARVDTWPTAFPTFGNQVGGFQFEAPPIPAKLMGQIVNFFERIYDRQHTEAAVLLVMHSETKEWRVFVPTQTLSHGGVNYVFDPTHIKMPWLLVGSIHSHCDFGAGHSGIDTGDADGFDGLHCTIGHIKRDIPQIVAMISMNKKLMHYKDEQFPLIFDFSEPKEHEAPAWWDRYCEDTVRKVKPAGFELFEKFKKPSVVKNENRTIITPIKPQPWTPQPQPWTPRLGYQPQPRSHPEFIPGVGIHRPLGSDPNDWSEFYRLQGLDGPPDGYAGYSPEQLMARGYVWDAEAQNWVWTSGRSAHGTSGILNESAKFNDQREKVRYGRKDFEDIGMLEQSDKYWEDSLGEEFVDILFESDLVSEDDVDFAIQNPETAGRPEHWKGLFIRKAFDAVRTLREMGMEIELDWPKSPSKDMDIALLPEQATPPEQMQKGLN